MSSEDEQGPEESLSMVNFLFGNVDSNGNLESDFFDPETKRNLSSLERLGCSGLLADLDVDNDQPGAFEDDGQDLEPLEDEEVDLDDLELTADKSSPRSQVSRPSEEKVDTDVTTADTSSSQPSITGPSTVSTSDVTGVATTVSEPACKTPTKTTGSPSNASVLSPQSSQTSKASSQPPLSTPSKDLDGAKLSTPLAAMLPEKYRDVDVCTIFPEFRKDSVLRFSRLFGAGKPSHLPQPWKNVKHKRTRDTTSRTSDGSLADDESDSFSIDLGDQPSPSQLLEDDEDLLQKPIELRKYGDEDDPEKQDSSPKIADWRFGPAQYWYDFVGLPESGEGYDYGMKVKASNESEMNGHHRSNDVEADPDDAYHLVTQIQWEDEIIWNGEEIKSKVLSKLNEKNHAAGWVPSGLNRTASAFTQQAKGSTPKVMKLPSVSNQVTNTPSKSNKAGDKNKIDNSNSIQDETWYSIFPVENEELIYGVWEDDIIWDAESMKKIPEPRILTLDPNDENIVLGIPDDIDPASIQAKTPAPIPLKEKKEHHLRKSRILLGKAGVIAEQEIEAPPPPTTVPKDPWNISNDEYYNPKTTTDIALKPNVGGNLIQHSIPALELRQPFFPTHMGQLKLRSFHRPALKKFSHGTIADTLPHSVLPLVKHIKKKSKAREAERQAAGGGEIFFMRTPEDLSGKDGDIILSEMSEEHPPLLSQVGMASKIKNYYKRRPGKDGGAPDYEYGETAYSQQSPFLGNLGPGQSLQTIENNLYRAPIYKHELPETDFLIIRTRNNYFIREVNTIFTVGQELPLFEVPGPNSKKANNFIRDFLQVFIYRLFYKSNDNPRRIKMEDIKKAFPSHSESSIRKRLKLCADFKRTGMDSNWWVLKPDFRLPTEDEMRAMVSPEQCCGFYSMIAAEQRLKDAGYGEKSLFAVEDDNDEETQLKMDDEVKAAPWNTTRAFIAAMNGKCLLQLNGVADPTGCGEGFSYIRIPNKPQISKEESQKEQMKEKKTVTGTDADLRRLPLNQAKQLLRKHGVPEDEIKKLSRWEVIDVVRTLSTEQAKAGSDTMSKFARGNRFSIAEHQERYKEECQRVFDLQNRVLSSNEVLSTDEDESEEEDSDIEEMGKNIENMLTNKKTHQDITEESEEAERRELRKLIMGDESNQGDSDKKKKKDDDDDNASRSSNSGRILKIYRTFKNPDGKEYTRIETVRKPAIIDTYVRIKQTKTVEFIHKFATALDDQQKEEKRKEKRRIQEQLRRLKRNEEREKRGFGKNPLTKDRLSKEGTDLDKEPARTFTDFAEIDIDDDSPVKGGDDSNAALSTPTSKKPLKEKKPKKIKEITMKCGACGAVGHMKTNRNCPLFRGGDGSLPPVQVAMTDEELREAERERMELEVEGQSLVQVDETKVVLSKKLIEHAEETRRKALVLKVPKELMKRKRRIGSDHCDYLARPEYKSANRRRTDPMVSLQMILEDLCTAMKSVESSDQFWRPVDTKLVPDYLQIISNPIDISTMRKKIREKSYQSRADFLKDVNLMIDNSIRYNGPNSVLTMVARKIYDLCVRTFEEKSERLAKLEKAINPLLDDNDQVAFSFLLDQVSEKLKCVPESWPFHKPVDKKKVKNYYDKIKSPMDLETIQNNVKDHKYSSINDFMNDIELIFKNSQEFNGPEHTITKKADEILREAKTQIESCGERLKELEDKISATKEAALDAADSESIITGGSNVGDRDDLSRPGSSAAHSYHEGDDSNFMDFEESSQHGHHDSQLLGRNISPDSIEPSTPTPDMSLMSQAMAAGQIPSTYPPVDNTADNNDEMIDEDYDPEDDLLHSLKSNQQAQQMQQQQQSMPQMQQQMIMHPPHPSEQMMHMQPHQSTSTYESATVAVMPPSSREDDNNQAARTPQHGNTNDDDADDDGLWF